MAKRTLARKQAVSLVAATLLALSRAAGAQAQTPPSGDPPSPTKAAQTMRLLTGRVVSADGARIAGAKVMYVASPADNDYNPTMLGSATTDRDGVFRFDDTADLFAFSFGPVKADGQRDGGTPYLLIQTPDGGGSCVNLPLSATDLTPLKVTVAPPVTLQVPVVGPDGKPLSGVCLNATMLEVGTDVERRHYYRLPPGMFPSKFSGEDGICTFPALPAAATVRVDPAGDTYATVPHEDSRYDLEADRLTVGRALKLFPGATITGHIAYADTGKPAAGIRVEAQGIGAGYGYAVTDADGDYRLTRLIQGTYNIVLALKTNNDWTAKAYEAVKVSAGQSLMGKDFVLIKGAIVTGRILGPDGKGVPGVPVGIYGPANPQSTAWVHENPTDAEGRYTLRVPPGKQYLYLMVEELDGFTLPDPKSKHIMLADGQTLVADWKLDWGTKAIAVTGTVLGPDGKPVANAEVKAEPLSDKPGGYYSPVFTDDKGTFRLEKVNKAIQLRARKGDMATLAPTTVAPGDCPRLKMAAHATASIAGQVTDKAGKPFPGIEVDLCTWKNGTRSRYSMGQTDAKGKYLFSYLWPDGIYAIEARADGHDRKYTERLVVKPGEVLIAPTLTLRDATGVATGRVVDANGEPLPGVRVSLSGRDNLEKSAVTDWKGRFRFEQIVDEKFDVQAQQQVTGREPNYIRKKSTILPAPDVDK